MDDERLNEAVRECLTRCYEATDIVPTIAQFLAKLKEESWDRDSMRAVELAVYRVLHGIIIGPTHAGETRDQLPSDSGSAGPEATILNGA
jgi:hypothetical protein